MSEEKKADQWAIVELFGHQRIAGRISEQTIGGCSFVRVDVPITGKVQAFTKLYGQGAIYAISFVDELAARTAASMFRETPVDTYTLRKALQALPEVIPQSENETEDSSTEF